MIINIIEEVSSALRRHRIDKHADFTVRYHDFNDDRGEADGNCVHAMNRYWRFIVARIDKLRGQSDRIATAMGSLTDSESKREWLNNFERYVIPLLREDE